MLAYRGMSQDEAMAFREGAPDAYGIAPEQKRSDGDAPCRCCLEMIAPGDEMLVLAYRPFSAPQPYAETGPVFLHAQACAPAGDGLPPVVVSPDYLLKAYGTDERIIYGTGRITPKDEIDAYAATLLSRSDVAFVDLRSARNNCWQARVSRG